MDISDFRKIPDQFVIPYMTGNNLLVNGARIKNSEIEKITIFQSDFSIATICAEHNATGNFVYQMRDILYGRMINRETYLTDITGYVTDFCAQELSKEQVVVEGTPVSKAEKREFSRAIFIVHGHDDLAIHQIKEFLRKLKFNPIVLREQANSGRTIIEKLIDHTQPNEIGYGIVLYTPCDKGCASGHEADLKSRARQNVVFEHGLLMGCLGRSRVHALVKGDIETPGDLGGVVYTAMDEPGAWQLGIIKELKALGYEVDANLL